MAGGDSVSRAPDSCHAQRRIFPLMMPEPQPSTNRMWRRFGFTALGIGIFLIGLVLYAMIFAYR